MASSSPAEMVVEGARPGKNAAFVSGSTVLRPGRLRVMHPDVAELLRSPRRHARPVASASTKPAAAPQQHPLVGRERARYACAFEEDDVGGGGSGGVAAPGRLVWGKVRDHPWWPGQVFDVADASSDARALRRRTRRHADVVLVAYFWDKTFAWNDAATLLPFRAGFPRLAAVRPVANAVDAALAEVARRVTAGLSCFCCGCGASRQVIDNAGVRDGAYGALMDAAFARGALQAEALVAYVSALATKPRAGADRVDLTVAAAQIKALGRWRGSTRDLPEYTVVYGIDGGVSATAKRRKSSTAGGGGDGSASAKRRVTRSSRSAATKGKAACDTGDYEGLEQEDLPLPTPPQQMSTKVGKLMSRAAQQMSLSPVILRANGGNSWPPPPLAVPVPDMARFGIAADEQFPPVSKNNGDHEAGLVLNFSSASAVPSPRHLTMIFSQFGPIKDVRAENSTALVIFNNGADADKAFSGTTKIDSIRASLVSFRVTASLPAAPVDDPPQPQSMPSDTSPVEALQ